ncbi:MAG: hypothetical protein OYH77_08630 [Pseudomonadota bacterium]|nr:hypothetical protein [Pseudomonadota bacterium]
MKHATTYLLIAFALMYALALTRTHLRNQTTSIGYDIGRLKTQELQLLEERNHLQMQLARLTAKDSLLTLAADR